MRRLIFSEEIMKHFMFQTGLKQQWQTQKKHRHPQTVAVLTILKHIGNTQHYNKKIRNQLYSKKSFPLEMLANTKNTDINRQLHFSQFSKTWIRPITLATFPKLISFTKKINSHLNPFHPANVTSALRISSASLFLQKQGDGPGPARQAQLAGMGKF